MKKILLTIIFLILFIIFPQQVSANKPKVAIIGSSSFSHGCKELPYRKGFVIQLREAYPDKNFECFAKGGQTTKYFKNQFNDNVKGKGFSELIIYAGLNGLAKELKPSQDDLIEIFRDAEKENITVIVISAQPFGKYQHWNQKWGDNIIKNHEWLKGKPEGIDYFVDIYSIIKDSANEYRMNPFYAMTDGLHMNKEGHDLMFEKISEIYETGSITNLNNTSNNTATPVSLTVNEIDRMVAQPTLQIRIPGLNFTGGLKITKKDGKTFIQTDFFQQYLVAVYKYSVIAISILAVFMIIVAGIQWMISGGSPDKIKAAQKRIGQSIVGLLIAVGSYTILYTINPYLVGFKALETEYIPQIKFDYSGDSDDMVGEFSSPSNIYCPKTGGASELPKIVNSMIGKVAYRFGGKGGAPPYAENKPECMKFNNFCPPGNLCLDCSGFVVYALKCAGINNINGGSGNVLKNTPLYTIDQVDFDKGTIDGIPLKTGDLIGWMGADYGKNCGNKQFIGHVLMFVKKVEGESGENFLAESSGGGCDEKNLGPEKSNSGRYANKNIRIKRFSQYKDKYFPRLPCPSDSRKIRVYRIPN